jgi:hypothetical protein
MPTIEITAPRPGTLVHNGQLVTVAGTVTDRGGAEPVMFQSVAVQLDGGTPVRAALHYRHDPTLTVADFSASIAATGSPGDHTLTAVVTDDNNLSRSVSETISLDEYGEVVGAPAVLLDLQLPGIAPSAIDPASLQSLLVTIQAAIAPASDLLAAAQKMLVGPSVAVQASASGGALLRLGLWIVDGGFHVDPPVAPFTLPRLRDDVAAASIGAVPALPQPTGGLMQFAFSIPDATVAELADAALPVLQQAVDGVSGISASTSPPSTVVTTVTGSRYDLGFTMTLTDTLGLSATTPKQPMATTSADLSGAAGLVLDISLVGIPLAMSAEDQAAKQGGVGAQVAAALPTLIPIRESDLPSVLATVFPDLPFPRVELQWETFGVSGGIVGNGLVWITNRAPDEPALQIDGPSSLRIPNGEFDVATAFTVDVTDLVPDAGGFTATITAPYDLPPTTSRTRTVPLSLGLLEQSADLPLDFRGPPRVNGHDVSGTSTWVLTVNAQETAASDASLTASATKHVALTYGSSGGPHNPPSHSPL